jgi:hypothetical protein
MKPNFIVVGAAKAGTTWLYYCLKEHPEVFVSTPKELNFFSNNSNFSKGFGWYENYFKETDSKIAVGELSPAYMYPPEVPGRIHAWNPDIKLIFILRKPIDRAYSDYCMNLDHGVFTPEVDKEMSTDSVIVHQGLYFEQIQRYLRYFPPEQLLVTFYDDLNSDPHSFLKKVYAFLGVKIDFQPEALNRRENAKKPLPKFKVAYESVRAIYDWLIQRNDLIKPFFDELKRKGYFDSFYALMRGYEHPKPSKATEAILTRFYKSDVMALAKFTDRDLSHWLDAE